MSEIDKKWYVVRAVSGQEKRVKETIETEVAAAAYKTTLVKFLYLSRKSSKSVTERRLVRKETCSLDTYTLKLH